MKDNITYKFSKLLSISEKIKNFDNIIISLTLNIGNRKVKMLYIVYQRVMVGLGMYDI